MPRFKISFYISPFLVTTVREILTVVFNKVHFKANNKNKTKQRKKHQQQKKRK